MCVQVMYKVLEEGGPEVPELIVIANGQGVALDGLAILRNKFDWTFEVLEQDPSLPGNETISWKGPDMGRANDVCFLDLLDANDELIESNEEGDGVDDHIFVLAAAEMSVQFPPEGSQDRLYKITHDEVNDRYIFEEIFQVWPYTRVLPDELWLGPGGDKRHQSQTVIPTRSMDGQGNLYLLLAGGY